MGAVSSARRRQQRMEREAMDFDKPAATASTGSLSSVNDDMRASSRSTIGRGLSQWAADPELLALQVDARDLQDVRRLGSGAFGVVWLVRYRQSTLLAAKRFRTDELAQFRGGEFVQEIKLVSRLAHPSVVRLVGVAMSGGDTAEDLQALFEYVNNGDLREFLQEPSVPLTWTADKLQVALDVAEALTYVHSFSPPLLHRDLKSRNILLDDRMRAKLTDFGVSRFLSSNNTMTQGVGTARWLAPEVLAGTQDYDQSADVFGFGCVLFELDAHTIPYAGARGPSGAKLADIAILQLVASGQLRPRFSRGCPAALRSLAKRCVAFDPRDRPTAADVARALRLLLDAAIRASAPSSDPQWRAASNQHSPAA
jgi:serine/threonine protein kinase